jgi:hypothetical protein
MCATDKWFCYIRRKIVQKPTYSALLALSATLSKDKGCGSAVRAAQRFVDASYVR